MFVFLFFILHQNHFSCQVDQKKIIFWCENTCTTTSLRRDLRLSLFLHFRRLFTASSIYLLPNFISLLVYFYPPHLTLFPLFLSVALKWRMDSTDMRPMHLVTLAGLLGVLGTVPYGPAPSFQRKLKA
jgi:hypothetical protein